MTELTDALHRAEVPLRSVIESVSADRWSSPSPCEGWTALDVVRHMVDTQRAFLVGQGVDQIEQLPLDDDPARAWKAHAEMLASLAADDTLMATAYDGHFGPTTIGETLRDFYVFDMVAHRWDIAVATGQDATLSDAELDQLERAIEGFGEAAYMPGVFRGAVQAPAGASRQDQVLARMGRVA